MSNDDTRSYYVGVDVGATKTLAAAVKPSGKVRGRARRATPRTDDPQDTLGVIFGAIDKAVDKAGVTLDQVSAIGLAVAAVVDPDAGKVVATPNMNLAGLDVVAPLEDRYSKPVALGNDVNMGTLGEQWLGAGRYLNHVLGMFIGTGIGGGMIIDGKLVRGRRELAGEVGHMVMVPDGPLCGCGNRGCLEALASRTAIERDIRQAIADGRESVIAEQLGDSDARIRSKMLWRALKGGDAVVTEVMTRAAEYIGRACVNIQHLLDPEVIILGGGVIQACGKFMVPAIRKVVDGDAYLSSSASGTIVPSELGDDAVVLGAVALARQAAGDAPLREASDTCPDYPHIEYATFGEIAVGDKVYSQDIYIRGDGKVKKRKAKIAKAAYGSLHKIGPAELDRICRGNPKVVVVGMGQNGMAVLAPEAEEMLRQRGIVVHSLPNAKAVRQYNRLTGRKAAVFHVTC